MDRTEELMQEAARCGAKVVDWDFRDTRIKGLYCDGVIAVSGRLARREQATASGDIIDQRDTGSRKQERRGRAWAYDRTGSLSETMRICAGLPGLPRSKGTFKSMLRNTLYIGKHPRNDHFCEPIIPEDLFERVNKGLRMNVKKSQKNVYIFSGLLRCGSCGCALGGNTRRRQRGNGKLEIIPQYRCPKHYTRVPAQCTNAKVISETVLEDYLIERIRGEIGALVYDVQAAPIRDTRAQAAAIEAKLKRLKDLYVEELISLEEYKADREAYISQLEELRAGAPAEADRDGLRELLKTDFEDLYYDMSNPEKRRFWRAILKEIRFSEDRTIDLYF